MRHPAPLTPSRWIIPQALLVALAFRALPVLLLPQTSFQPDEFYQSLEPAHALVFGYGHLTWEWRDLPLIGAKNGWYDQTVVSGRMRGWIWPGVFAIVYKAMSALGYEEQLLTLAPRLVGAVVAALTDYTTYLLGVKFLGSGAGPAAMLLSMASLFNAHLIPRALSTSPETLLTSLALLYFPLPTPESPAAISIGNSKSMSTKAMEAAPKSNPDGQTLHLPSEQEMDYVMMDRMAPHLERNDLPSSSLFVSAALATLAVSIRPTTLPFWAYLGLEHLLRIRTEVGVFQALKDVIKAVIAAALVFSSSTGIDYAITGRLYFPILTFIHYNLFSGLSANYGSTTPLYHLTQSLPIMLFPIWYWFGKGFLASLLPSSALPLPLSTLDRPACLRTLARGLAFAITALSFSPHSEWRFLHPFLPSLLLFALPPIFRSYTVVQGVGGMSTIFRQYLRISRKTFKLIVLAPIIPYLYLNIFHGRAQVEVMIALRRGDIGEVQSLVALMPCHSTPWMSHLHKDVSAWFLTCEPPLGVSKNQHHHTQQSIFYESPISYLETVFPYPPSPLHKIFSSDAINIALPSHILLFGSLLEVRSGTTSFRDVLREKGYEETWKMWNGVDWAQDEAERRGGVRVWRLMS